MFNFSGEITNLDKFSFIEIVIDKNNNRKIIEFP